MAEKRATKGAAALFAGVVLAVAGCGGGEPPPAAGAGACSGEFPIGTVLPLSGATADTGQSITAGVDLAAEELNAAGGILGRCVVIVARDEANDPTKAAQAASLLVDREDVKAIIGPAGSGALGAVAPIARDAGVPVMHSAAAVLQRAEYPEVFGVQITSDLIGPSFAEYAAGAGYTSVAVLAVNNALGTTLLDSTTAAATERGVAVVGSEVFESGSLDLVPQLRALRDRSPAALVLAGFGADAVVALKAREQLGWDVPVIGPSGLAFNEVVTGVGPKGMEKVYASMVPRNLSADPTTGALVAPAEELRTALKESTGQDPLTRSLDALALGYDALKALAHGFAGAGSDDGAATSAYLIGHPYDGVRTAYTWNDRTTSGFPLASNSVIVAASLEDGALTLAPGQ